MSYQPNNINGQATMANSSPVVLASDQSAIPFSDGGGSITIDGTVGISGSVAVTGAFYQATQPVSLTSLPSLVAGTALIGKVGIDQTTNGTTNRVNIGTDGSVTILNSSLAVTGPLTDTQLRATALPVSISGALPVTDNGGSLTVDGTVAVSNSFALDATLTGGTQKSIMRGGAKGSTTAADLTSTSVDANTQALDVSIKGTVPVSGTFWQATQPVSLASLPSLATGSNVIGAVTQSGTWNIGSITTLPSITGTVTSNIGTTNGLALDTTLTGGTQKGIVRGGAKGTSTAADVTSTASGLNHQVLDVGIYDASGNLKDPTQIRALTSSDQITIANASIAVTGTFWQATQPVSIAATVSTNIAQMNGVTVAMGSGAVSTGTQRVILATDQPVIPVSDNGGSLTVDGTVAVTGTFWQATQPVSIASTLSVQGNKAEDAASADGDLGFPLLAVRKATPANTSGTDGDYEFLQISAGRLWTSSTIDAALPAGTNAIGKLAANDGVDIGDVTINNASIAVTGTFWQATQPVSLTTLPALVAGSAIIGKVGIDQTTNGTTNRVNIGTDGTVAINAAIPAGTNTIGNVKLTDGTLTLSLLNTAPGSDTGQVAVPVRIISSLASAGGTQYTEDAASAADPVGNILLGRRRDTLSATEVSADGDNIALNSTSKGELYVKHTDSIAVTGTFWQATQPVSIAASVAVTDNSGSLTVDAPVGTPVFTRLSDGTAALIGQKVMAVSLPVVLASDQSALAVTGTFWQATQPVSLASVPSHAVTNAGTFAVQDSEKIADNAAFTDGTSKVLIAGFIYDEVAGTALTENDAAAARINVNRALVNALEDGATRGRYATVTASNALKVDGSAVTQPVSIAATVATSSSPATSGGLSVFHLVSAGTTNATVIKASAGQLYGWFIYNGAASARKIAFHNTASTPTAGASVLFSIMIPSGSGANVEYSNGLAFSTGIAITTVTDIADTGTTAVAANDLNINIFYK